MNSKKFIPKVGQYYWSVVIGINNLPRTEQRKRFDFYDDESDFDFNCFETDKHAEAIAAQVEKLLKNY